MPAKWRRQSCTVPRFSPPEEIALFRSAPDYDRTPRADGGHISQWFARKFAGDPEPSETGTLFGLTWMLISKFSMGEDIARVAVFENE